MDSTLADLLSAVEHYGHTINESEYQALLDKLKDTHEKTAEGLASEKREKERQIREDERVAREFQVQAQAQAQVQGGAQLPPPPFQFQIELPTMVKNIMYNCQAGTEYNPNILYHRVRSDGMDTIRNPDTGIFVIVDGKRGLSILDKYEYDYPEFIDMMPLSSEE